MSSAATGQYLVPMLFLQWLFLLILTALAGLNSIALALRLGCSRRSEQAIVAFTAFYAFVAAPVLVLGFTNHLTAVHLGELSTALMVGAFFLLARGRSAGTFVRACAGVAGRLALIPFDALREAWRARSVVSLGLLCAGGIIAYAFIVTVLVQCTSWDGLMYHEPIAGFAIQNHGFAPVALPPNDTVQATNGYPRLCEAVSIWFVIFTDRTLSELPNVLSAPAMMLVAYAIARRYGDRVTAMGWACVLPLMPQTWAQLCQVYIDVEVAFFTLAAIYFATQPKERIRDAAMAVVALALLAGSKFSALSTVFPIALVAFVRLHPHFRVRPLSVLAAVVGGTAILVVVMAVMPLRNWQAFGNPLWPASYDNSRLGIHWAGLKPIAAIVADAPLADIVQAAYDTPIHGFGDVIHRGYGYGIAWVVIPLGLLGAIAAMLAMAAEGLGIKERSALTRNVGWIVALLVVGLVTTPTLSGRNARYNIHLVACLMVAATWLLRGRSWGRAREGFVAAAIVLSIPPFFWLDGWQWSWGMTDDPRSIFRHPFAHHQYLEKPAFDYLPEQRASELKAGDRVVFDEGIIFVGTLWNFEFSNKVQYVPYGAHPSETDYLKTVREWDAKWVAAGTAGAQAALRNSRDWELVGKLSPVGEQQVFRRVTVHRPM